MVFDINKIAALCIRDKKLLVVHKKKIGYISLGGKINQGETDLQCLEREVKEEIGCTVKNPKHFATFEGPTHDFKQTLRMVCYFCDIEGEITLNPEDTIDGYRWIGKEDLPEIENELAHMLKKNIIPELIKKELL